MKKIILLGVIAQCFLAFACKEYSVSYLNAKNLNYPLNYMEIVQGLTEEDMYVPGTDKKPSKYKSRIENKAPWLSKPFWGGTVEGSRPLAFEISEVKLKGEKANAQKLIENVSFMGEGIFIVPFKNDIPLGEYLISLKISNIAGSEIVKDCFTIIVTDKKEW